jgi:hypothetical protein
MSFDGRYLRQQDRGNGYVDMKRGIKSRYALVESSIEDDDLTAGSGCW